MQTPSSLMSGSIRAQIQQIYSLTGPYTSFYGCGTQQFQNQSSHISKSIKKSLNFTLKILFTQLKMLVSSFTWWLGQWPVHSETGTVILDMDSEQRVGRWSCPWSRHIPQDPFSLVYDRSELKPGKDWIEWYLGMNHVKAGLLCHPYYTTQTFNNLKWIVRVRT